MTIPATPRRSPVYVGNGVATSYAFGFKVTDPTTVVVTVADADDLNATELVYGVDFTVTLNVDQNASPGGEISYAGLAVGHRLVITSNVESSQPTEVTNLGAFHAHVLEGALDRLAILHQQQQEQIDRAVKVSVTSEQDPSEFLQDSIDLAANSAAQAAASASTALDYRNEAEGFRDEAEGFRDNAADSESNAAASAVAAAGSESNAAASAVAAAGSESNAAASAFSASVSAVTASDAAAMAASSALGAGASADAAALSESNAASSAASAATKAGEASASADLAASYATTVGTQSFRNKIINGNFDIWQRGSSHSTVGYGSADRWSVLLAGGATATMSWQAFTVGQTDVPGEPLAFMRMVANSGAASSSYAIATQRIEDVRRLAGRSVTLSFYAKADAPKNIAVELAQFFGSSGSMMVTGLGSQLVALTTAWQKFEITAVMPSIAGKTISGGDDYTQLLFWYGAGSDLDARSASLGNQSGTFDIAQVQLEEGNVATPFEQRPIGLELSLCQRYFQVYASAIVDGYGSAGSTHYGGWPFTTHMRTAPTASIVPGTTAQSNADAITAAYADRYGFRLRCSVTTLGDFWSTGNITFDAEL